MLISASLISLGSYRKLSIPAFRSPVPTNSSLGRVVLRAWSTLRIVGPVGNFNDGILTRHTSNSQYPRTPLINLTLGAFTKRFPASAPRILGSDIDFR